MGHLLFGSMVRLMVTSSKRAYATGCVAGSSNQSPCPYSRPLLTFTSAGDSNTGLTQSLWGLWVLVSTRFYLSPPSVSCCRVGGIECSSACIGPFEESCHYLHYLHHSLVSGQTTEREQSPTHQQNYIVQEAVIKTIPKKKKGKKAKWLSEEALQKAEKRREAKGKGAKERYTHLNAEFQWIPRREKKAFLSEQCK